MNITLLIDIFVSFLEEDKSLSKYHHLISFFCGNIYCTVMKERNIGQP